MVPAANIVYRAEQGYKGAHYDHFANWFTAIRTAHGRRGPGVRVSRRGAGARLAPELLREARDPSGPGRDEARQVGARHQGQLSSRGLARSTILWFWLPSRPRG